MEDQVKQKGKRLAECVDAFHYYRTAGKEKISETCLDNVQSIMETFPCKNAKTILSVAHSGDWVGNWNLIINESCGESLLISCSFHHHLGPTECGWSHHEFTVTPSLLHDYHIKSRYEDVSIPEGVDKCLVNKINQQLRTVLYKELRKRME